MKRKTPSRRTIRSLCAEFHPDDGADPREWSREGRSGDRKLKRKTQQLCGQVAEVLGQMLAGGCGDDVLQSLQIVAVEPAPDVSRLMVTVRLCDASEDIEPARVLEHLVRASSRLRCEVAAAITRKRAPSLAFRLALPVG